jgi:hypothetical protein
MRSPRLRNPIAHVINILKYSRRPVRTTGNRELAACMSACHNTWPNRLCPQGLGLMRSSYSKWLYGQACAAGILDQIYEFRLLVKDLSADPRIGGGVDEPVNFPVHLGLALQTPRHGPTIYCLLGTAMAPRLLRFPAIAIPRNRDQGASSRVRQLGRAVGIYP